MLKPVKSLVFCQTFLIWCLVHGSDNDDDDDNNENMMAVMVGLMVVMMMMISQVQQTSSMVQLHRVSWLIEYFQISANIMELSNVHLCRDEDEDHDDDDHNEHDDDD